MGKVKLEDLSIGNWVCAEVLSGVSGNVRLTPPMRVVSLGEGADGWVNLRIDPEQGDDFEYEPSEIRGVPITCEILTQNGFTRMADEEEPVPCFEIDYECYIQKFNDCWRIRSYANLAIVCDVNYIHEMQNALRLMKIEKEIVL